MNRDCNHIQETIVEGGGVVESLGHALRAHVEACESCRSVAEEESKLINLLDDAVPPEDQILQQRIVEAVHRAKVRRHLWSALPVAASLVVTFLGVAMMGGVPAGGLAAQLVLTGSGSGWASAMASLGGLMTVFSATVEALAQLVTPAIGVLATAGVLLGSLSMGKLSRRWKLQPEWRVRN